MKIDCLFFVAKLDNPGYSQTIIDKIKASVKIPCYQDLDDIANAENILFVAVGGDGTAIDTAKLASRYGMPILIINTGKLGFLKCYDVEQALSIFPSLDFNNIFSGKNNLKVVKRHFIDAESDSYSRDCYFSSKALNEFTISHAVSDNIVKVHLYINGESAGTHKANGVLISTATGSTAYSLSVGGAIMLPQSKLMQISFIAPMSLTSRPIILSSDDHVEIFILKDIENTRLKSDCIEVNIKKNDKINIRMTSNPVLFLYPKNWEFFNVIENRLGWNYQPD